MFWKGKLGEIKTNLYFILFFPLAFHICYINFCLAGCNRNAYSNFHQEVFFEYASPRSVGIPSTLGLRRGPPPTDWKSFCIHQRRHRDMSMDHWHWCEHHRYPLQCQDCPFYPNSFVQYCAVWRTFWSFCDVWDHQRMNRRYNSIQVPGAFPIEPRD